MQNSVLRLFKGFIGSRSEDLVVAGLKYGLLIPNSAPRDVVKEAIELYGKDGEKWNKTFHKSWDKVASAPIEQLVLEQLIHYFTTYGYESLGVFDHDLVYLPKEDLDIPGLSEDIELSVIHAYTEDEVREKLMTMITSGIALSKRTLEDIENLSDLIDLSRINEIANRELKIYLYDKYQKVPADPDEFFRYLLYKLTGTTLKVQDKTTIGLIKHYRSDRDKITIDLLDRYIADQGIEKLASIFLRNKKLFLALKIKPGEIDAFRLNHKEAKKINHLVNKIRKEADRYHKPMPIDVLSQLTNPDLSIDLEKVLTKLNDVTIFREIRIVNALRDRISGNQSAVYKIRNGKSYATNRKVKNSAELEARLVAIQKHLIDRIDKKIGGKTFYIPKEVDYKLPTSEKQFIGPIPSGTSITIDRTGDLVFGIYWKNLKNSRVDLDLHAENEDESFGWSGSYRDDYILFSGDVTDAPNGATELFYVSTKVDKADLVMTVNNYTQQDEDVEFEFVVAKANKDQFDKQRTQRDNSYMLDPNDILFKTDSVMEPGKSELRLGIIKFNDGYVSIDFDKFSSGNSAVSYNQELLKITKEYQQSYHRNQLSLLEVLAKTSAKLVETPMINQTTVNEDGLEVIEQIPVDYDLSIEKLTKDTFIDMFAGA